MQNEIELPLVAVLVEIERNGLKLDVDALAKAASGFEAEIEQLETDIYDLAGEKFTIGSPKQLGPILFDKLGLPRGRKGKTGWSTDARVLGSIRDAHPIVEKIERWRELTKLKSTYVDSLPKDVSPVDGRIHTTLDQTRAATGRLSSTNPNLQNIPVRTPLGATIRECFVAEKGNLLTSADYSQVELRVLAQVADDKTLKDIFRRGEDVHTETAAAIFGIDPADVDHATRDRAKAVNFGIIYGLSAFGLSDRLKIPRDEAAEFIKRYLDRFEGVKQFMDDTVAQAKKDGYVTTLIGRRRAIPELASSQVQTRNLGERLAINTVVQGTAADIIKKAMIDCSRALKEADVETKLVMQIHDELLFEGPDVRSRPDRRTGRTRDGRRLSARSALGRFGRQRSELAGGEVMDRTLAVLITAGVGGALAMQAPINGQLGLSIGKLQAALVSFVVGTTLLMLIVFLFAGGMS